MSQSASPHIRPLHTLDEFMTVARLEVAIWKIEDIESTSAHLMLVLSQSGGVVLGAELDDELIGFSYGVPARRHGEWLLWSHMSGVLQQYQGQNVGFQLKQAQREWARDNGYHAIAWTFDPMRRGNANFNLRRLGTFGKSYSPDHYGVMTDAINAGMASDRLETWWIVDDPDVIARSDGTFRSVSVPVEEINFLLESLDGEVRLNIPDAFTAPYYATEVPMDLDALKATRIEFAQQWQRQLRASMQAAFAARYSPMDFVTEARRCYYVWQKTTTL
jgi:predicted GNAT superfamily acetyltransferase